MKHQCHKKLGSQDRTALPPMPNSTFELIINYKFFRHMKKISIIFITTLFIGACNSEKTSEQIQNEIFDYKQKIITLEKELEKNQNKSDEKIFKVKTVIAELKNVKHNFTSTGTVTAQNLAYISPEMNGQIRQIHVTEGQFVSKGQLLVSLNSDVIGSNITELKTGLELANVMFEKQKMLWEQKIGKEIDYLQAKNQKESLEAKLNTVNAQLKMSRIYAPFAGIVDEIYSKPGEMAIPGRQVIDLVNLDVMEIEAEVSEKYIPNIQKGDSVIISFPTYPDMIKKAIILRTGNIINPANRTFKIVVSITNKEKNIKPNMIAELTLSDYNGKNISVPSVIIKKDKEGYYVYVTAKKNEQDVAEKRYIEPGFQYGNFTVIDSGITVGESIITDGFNLINQGSHIQIVK